jgi:hypothetical protein
MAAVVAAIGAAFLAGAIALFREHRQQQRHLLVAARVMHSSFGVAYQSIRTTLEADEWAVFNSVPGQASFSMAWETYKGDLGGHLAWSEWRKVEAVASGYMALTAISQEEQPRKSENVLGEVRDALLVGREVLLPYCATRLSIWMVLRRSLEARKS